MDQAERDRRIAGYQALCRERGLRNTVQKRTVLETVLGLEGHPTAEQVYETVGQAHPEISRTTVYRALESFVRLGLISRASHPDRVARYDIRTDVHHHLLCLHCNQFVDFEDHGLDSIEIPDTSALGFEVSSFSVQLRGICRSCRDTMRREEPS